MDKRSLQHSSYPYMKQGKSSPHVDLLTQNQVLRFQLPVRYTSLLLAWVYLLFFLLLPAWRAINLVALQSAQAENEVVCDIPAVGAAS